ncbi:hypothetical protein Mapa_004703 [Marchantia paleacea]|nr:hypothetical protein Mapa_004703 [Marchantia paleacea]
MKSDTLLLALLVLASTSGRAEARKLYTYVSNESSRAIRATTRYGGGASSKFTDRLTTPGTHQHDECEPTAVSKVHTEVWHKNFDIDSDRSLVAKDNADRSAVDVFWLRMELLLFQTAKLLSSSIRNERTRTAVAYCVYSCYYFIVYYGTVLNNIGLGNVCKSRYFSSSDNDNGTQLLPKLFTIELPDDSG